MNLRYTSENLLSRFKIVIVQQAWLVKGRKNSVWLIDWLNLLTAQKWIKIAMKCRIK